MSITGVPPVIQRRDTFDTLDQLAGRGDRESFGVPPLGGRKTSPTRLKAVLQTGKPSAKGHALSCQPALACGGWVGIMAGKGSCRMGLIDPQAFDLVGSMLRVARPNSFDRVPPWRSYTAKLRLAVPPERDLNSQG